MSQHGKNCDCEACVICRTPSAFDEFRVENRRRYPRGGPSVSSSNFSGGVVDGIDHDAPDGNCGCWVHRLIEFRRNPKITPVTGIILNWKRPGNVHRVLDGWQAGGIVTEAICWNNNPSSEFAHDWAKVVNANCDLGLYTRFAAALLASNDCLLIQDDDLELPDETLKKLLIEWEQAPDVLHGVFGRNPKPDGSYDGRNAPAGECPIVLTRALMAHKKHAVAFFRHLPRFEEIMADSKPFGNGEDIIFSHVVMRSTRFNWMDGRLTHSMNRVHRLPVKELPAPHAIHGRGGREHYRHRTNVLRSCQSWLEAPDVVSSR